MKQYRVEVTRKTIEVGYITVGADNISHAHAITNDWVFNKTEQEACFYDSCHYENKEVTEGITCVRLIEEG